ncbi:MAG TPA: prolipoprotein diacylglyceryl transferase [Candidatus Acidoferrales bacterium]|nr:prolipoprotein diacylglyceryl transferase [Candidatus Acidoferrales bacterium]
MHPILFHIGSFPIYTYGVLVASGVLISLWFGTRYAPRAGLTGDFMWNLSIYGILLGLIASKVWLIVSDWSYYSANPGEIFSIATFQSAGTFYGGVIGAVILIVVYSRIHKAPLLAVFDVGAIMISLGHAIGRLGCFVAGCCYGKPTSLPWGVTFTDPVAERIAGTPLGIRLHPTQLYESAAEFLNFFLMWWLSKRQKFTGQIFGTFFILYGFERGTIEFFRGDPGRTMMFHDSVSLMQLVSVGLILIGAFIWWRGLRASAPVTPAAPTRVAAGRP